MSGFGLSLSAMSIDEDSDATEPPLSVLIVSGDMHSHAYAVCKLAKVLNTKHHVAVAAPGASVAYDIVERELRYDTAVDVLAAGTTTTVRHMNERAVQDPFAWSTFLTKARNPFGFVDALQGAADHQEPMYEPLKQLIPHYDCVIAIHSICSTAMDALESVNQERQRHHQPSIPGMVFISLPYDPKLISNFNENWWQNGAMTVFPHVSTFSSGESQDVRPLAWKVFDSALTEYGFSVHAKKRSDARRQRRGLPLLDHFLRDYFQRYPVLTMGGQPLLTYDATAVPRNVHVIGSVQLPTQQTPPQNDSANRPVVYLAFGTGTELNELETERLTFDLPLQLADSHPHFQIIWALRKSEYERLKGVIERGVNATTKVNVSEGVIEYRGGQLRIEHCVDQTQLLNSGRVKLFVSHFGFGSYQESVYAGVPLVSYPSGCDQFYNAQCAKERGVAMPAKFLLEDIGQTVSEALKNTTLKANVKYLSVQWKLCSQAGIDTMFQVIQQETQEIQQSKTLQQTPLEATPVELPVLEPSPHRHHHHRHHHHHHRHQKDLLSSPCVC